MSAIEFTKQFVCFACSGLVFAHTVLQMHIGGEIAVFHTVATAYAGFPTSLGNLKMKLDDNERAIFDSDLKPYHLGPEYFERL